MDPYHEGSRAVQERVGVRELADHVGRSIGRGIKPVAAAFLGLQPMLVVGAADRGGRLWASLLTGEPGFVRATGPRTVSVGAVPVAGDPLAAVLAEDETPVGTIALDPRTRRRMRLNGTAAPGARGFTVTAGEVFANCPKYLQHRELMPAEAELPAPGPARHSPRLDAAQRRAVAEADTFFVATAAGDGVDVSHRGGNPGFVEVHSPNELSWPDYPGNAMFLTLGNLRTDPRAGLLFVDWTGGTTLQLTGTARTDFTADGGRTVRFRITEAVEVPAASPLRWTGPRYSPANPVPPR
ncbi:pyridoxamine 5'-phosphate oxidase family protein [Streptomyces sp. GC420]|uniref:pyridoxamine 5'-phosphate oxidase family protein n=1 Tax=Streptomyces sp. GC420 TaxID=2697568 RepID=UPI00141510D7|nr:pyridoxamine 5'-phosphate oxidase family protein [Streptomyces sp. GC420]NBM18031.1 pyridoxamine 5'-phosphate oxidase family protein [Streptomyces sp. GC420]